MRVTVEFRALQTITVEVDENSDIDLVDQAIDLAWEEARFNRSDDWELDEYWCYDKEGKSLG